MSDRRCLTSEFLSSPQTCPDLHRMCTAISALPLARIAVAGAKSIHVMKVAAEVCPFCEGTGWKSVANGSDRRVTRCDCRVQARSEALLKAARIPKRYEHCELQTSTMKARTRRCFRHAWLLASSWRSIRSTTP